MTFAERSLQQGLEKTFIRNSNRRHSPTFESCPKYIARSPQNLKKAFVINNKIAHEEK